MKLLQAPAILIAAALIALAPSPAHAAAEEVLLYKVIGGGDEGIIVRANGDAYQIRKGVGCLGFGSREGRTIIITSPGLFLGVGSEVVIPERGQSCRVWESTSVGNIAGIGQPTPAVPPVGRDLPPTRAQPANQVVVAATQAALSLLGIDPGPVDGSLGAKTAQALRSFQESHGLPASGTPDTTTRLALSNELAKQFPEDPNVLTIVAGLLTSAPPRANPPLGSGCEDGHWVQSVSGGGAIVVLEDSSVWEVDLIDKIDTMLWLPTEEVLVCGSTLINTDNGDKIHATRLK
jgi:hypothetical protein